MDGMTLLYQSRPVISKHAFAPPKPVDGISLIG